MPETTVHVGDRVRWGRRGTVIWTVTAIAPVTERDTAAVRAEGDLVHLVSTRTGRRDATFAPQLTLVERLEETVSVPAVDPDPLEAVTALGVRLVFLPDFNGRILLADNGRMAIVDPAISRRVAARSLLDVLHDPSTGT